jgi:hypothetical protein
MTHTDLGTSQRIPAQRSPGVAPPTPTTDAGGLQWGDVVATITVAGATTAYALWLTDVALTGISTRAMAVLVFALGWAGCMTVGNRMGALYGAAGSPLRQRVYAVTTSLLGAVALVSGVAAIVTAGQTALAVLVLAMVALWVAATVRHALSG